MNIEQLQYICMVAKTNSITVAAENLYVTQQTISKAINKLEMEIEKKLLIRSHKGVTLTEDGEVFVERASKIVGEFQELYGLMCHGEEGNKLNGQLRLRCSPYIIHSVVPTLLANYYKVYPNVNIAIKEQLSMDILEDVSNMDNGVGLLTIVNDNTGSGRIQSFADVLEWEELYQDTLVGYVSSNHPLASKKKASFRELVAYPWVLGDCPGFECILNQDYGLNPKILINSGNATLHSKAVAEGTAVGFSSELINRCMDYVDGFVTIAIKEQPKLVTILVKSKGYPLSKLQHMLFDEVKQVFRSL